MCSSPLSSLPVSGCTADYQLSQLGHRPFCPVKYKVHENICQRNWRVIISQLYVQWLSGVSGLCLVFCGWFVKQTASSGSADKAKARLVMLGESRCLIYIPSLCFYALCFLAEPHWGNTDTKLNFHEASDFGNYIFSLTNHTAEAFLWNPLFHWS